MTQQHSEGLPVVAWGHPDGRVVPAATMHAGQRDGGAMASSLSGYSIPLTDHAAATARIAALKAELAEVKRERDHYAMAADQEARLGDEARAQLAELRAAARGAILEGARGQWTGNRVSEEDAAEAVRQAADLRRLKAVACPGADQDTLEAAAALLLKLVGKEGV